MFMDSVCKTLLHGAGTAIAAYCCFPPTYVSVYPLPNMPGWAFAGLLGLGTSVITDVAHTIFKPEIDASDKSMDITALLLSTAISAGVYAAIIGYADPYFFKTQGLTKIALVGAAGEVVGSYGCPLLQAYI